MIQTAETGSAIQIVASVNPSQARWMKALPSNPRKKRVPRVVGIIRKPLRSIVGDINSHTSMPHNIKKMVMKKMAVGRVQYIHSKLIVVPSLYPAQGEALGEMISHKPDHQ